MWLTALGQEIYQVKKIRKDKRIGSCKMGRFRRNKIKIGWNSDFVNRIQEVRYRKI